MRTSSSDADTTADPESSIVSTLSETESGVYPENSTEVFCILKYSRSSVQYASKNAV